MRAGSSPGVVGTPSSRRGRGVTAGMRGWAAAARRRQLHADCATSGGHASETGTRIAAQLAVLLRRRAGGRNAVALSDALCRVAGATR